MRIRFSSFTSALFVLSLVPVFGLTPGCSGGSVSGVCQEICACQGCTTKDLNDCEDEAATATQKADDAGCGGEFDDYLACIEENMSCRDEDAAGAACGGILTEVNECMKGTGIILGDPCEAASAHLAECLGSDVGSGGEGNECKGQAACTASCINSASCEAISDAFNGQPSDVSQPFFDCINNCANSSSSGSGGQGGFAEEPPSPGDGVGGAGGTSSTGSTSSSGQGGGG